MKPKSTVLIVDDQPAMRDALEGLLSNQGYEVSFCNQWTRSVLQSGAVNLGYYPFRRDDAGYGWF